MMMVIYGLVQEEMVVGTNIETMLCPVLIKSISAQILVYLSII